VKNRTISLPPINSWFIYYTRAENSSSSGDESLVYCLQSTYMQTAYCLQNAHTPHSAEQVLKEWNPHMLLLGLACLHLHVTLVRLVIFWSWAAACMQG
jgi:hypothetical protein